MIVNPHCAWIRCHTHTVRCSGSVCVNVNGLYSIMNIVCVSVICETMEGLTTVDTQPALTLKSI